MSTPRSLLSRWEISGGGVLVWLFLLMMIGDRFDWPILKYNAVILLAIVPYAWIVWLLMGRRWILLCGLLLGFAVMLVYWVKAMANSDAPLELLLLPAPVFLLVGVAWAPLARLTLNWAQRRKNRPMSGPGTQTLAMVSLFLPTILVAIFVPDMLELSGIWSAVSLTIVGVLLSAVVAQPLHRFLLEWAKLEPDDKQAGLV